MSNKINPHEMEVLRLRRDLRQLLQGIVDVSYASKEWVRQFVLFVMENQASFVKDLVYYSLEFLVDKEDLYGGFYDHHTDEEFGEPVYESLADVWVRNNLESKDFELVQEIIERFAYVTTYAFFERVVCPENAMSVVEFDEDIWDLFREENYIHFLINTGQVEKCVDKLLNDSYMPLTERFRFLLRLDEQKALGFSRHKKLDPQLVFYYGARNNSSQIIQIFNEAVGSKTRSKNLIENRVAVDMIYQAIQSSSDLNSEKKIEAMKKLVKLAPKRKHPELRAKIDQKISEAEGHPSHLRTFEW